MNFLKEHSQGSTISLRVVPRCSKVGPMGFYGSGNEQLKWGVSAAPHDGEANKELIASLSKFFGIAKSKVVIVKGESSRSKVILLEGLAREECAKTLSNYI